MVYVEFPFDNIVAVHWKKKPDDGGGGPPKWPPGPCASGWFPFSGWNDGGNGYPPQLTGEGPIVLAVGPTADWNFWTLTQSRTDEEMLPFYIPGGGATSVTVAVQWAGVVAPVTGPPFVAGIWIIPVGYGDRPPFHGPGGVPPPNPYPFDPNLSAPVVGTGSLTLDVPAPGFAMLELGFAQSGGGSRDAARMSRLSSPLMPALQDGTHYGWPGNPPDEGIWITVDYACGSSG